MNTLVNKPVKDCVIILAITIFISVCLIIFGIIYSYPQISFITTFLVSMIIILGSIILIMLIFIIKCINNTIDMAKDEVNYYKEASKFFNTKSTETEEVKCGLRKAIKQLEYVKHSLMVEYNFGFNGSHQMSEDIKRLSDAINEIENEYKG